MMLSKPRLLALLGLALLLATASAESSSSADPLWDDIATIEAEQAAANASASSAGVMRMPLKRRDPRDVASAILSRPAP